MSSDGSSSSSSSYDQGNIETGVGAAMIALSIIFVFLRFYARIRTKAGLGGDDWLVMVALTGNVVAALLVLAGMFLPLLLLLIHFPVEQSRRVGPSGLTMLLQPRP